MKKLLVIRFSALGDVAMTVPVIHSLAEQYPDLQITFLSQKFCESFFCNMPKNVEFLGADIRKEQHSLLSLNRFLRQNISLSDFDAVADFHGVLRSTFIDLKALLRCKKVAVIRKGQSEKRALTRANNKVFRPVKSSIERYVDVLARLGLTVNIDFKSIFTEKATEKAIGFAPFAKHQGKILPAEITEKTIALLAEKKDYTIYLFGGGATEKAQLESWSANYENVVSVAGKYAFIDEIKLINRLQAMITMDSANMHIASLVSTPVVSIWGATHPYAGFMGYGQKIENAVQVDLPCRPCSVFGNKPCFRGDYACMRQISPQNILEKVDMIINKTQLS